MADLFLVDYSVGWIPSSLALTKADKAALAAQRGVDPRQVRGHYSVLGGRKDHPIINQGWTLYRAINALRDKYLIPEAVYAVAASGVDSGQRVVRRARNSYVMPVATFESFATELESLRSQYLRWGEELCRPREGVSYYEEIKTLDATAIAASWSVLSHRYPSCQQLLDSIVCTVPVPTRMAVDIDVSGVSARFASQIQEEARNRIQLATENIEATLLGEFQSFIEDVRRSCGYVVRVQPGKTGALSKYHDADVAEYLEHEQRPDEIPAGHCRVSLRPRARQVTTITLPITQYQADFRPTKTDDYRKLSPSAFENLLEATNKIASFRNQLRDADDQNFLVTFSQRVESMLRQHGSSAVQIKETLRNNPVTRDNLRQTFDGLLTELQESTITTRAAQFRRRRKIVFEADADE